MRSVPPRRRSSFADSCGTVTRAAEGTLRRVLISPFYQHCQCGYYDKVLYPSDSSADEDSYNTNRLSQRSQLFPEDRYDGSRSASPSLRAQQGYNTTSNRFDSQVMDTLESQNYDMIESLSSKVKILKNVRLPPKDTSFNQT